MNTVRALASIAVVCGCGWPLLAQEPQRPVPTAAWAPKPIATPAYPPGHRPWLKLSDLKARHKGEASWTEKPKLEGRQMVMMIAPGRKKPSVKPVAESAPAASA